MKNLVVRTLSGIVYVAVLVAAFLFNKFAFIAVMMVIAGLMMHEFHKMNLGKAFPVQRFIAVFTGLYIIAAVFCVKAFALDAALLCTAVIPLLALATSILFLKDRSELQKTALTFASVLYVAVPISLFSLLVFREGTEFSGDWLLMFIALVWMSDIGAYVFGLLLGQKFGPKLCPGISPKKSWIGAIGGFVVTVGCAVAFHCTGLLDIPVWHCIALGAIIDVTGIFGDLFESVWKRHCGVKDSGNIIPGHGGMMDRFDSAVFAIPAAIAYLYIFNII